MEEIIPQGEHIFQAKLAGKCDFIYIFNGDTCSRWSTDYQNKFVDINSLDKIKSNAVIFIDCSFFGCFGELNNIPVPFRLLSGFNDYTIPQFDNAASIDQGTYLLNNANLQKWYGINVDTTWRGPGWEKLVQIPIGMSPNRPHQEYNYMVYSSSDLSATVETIIYNMFGPINLKERLCKKDKKFLVNTRCSHMTSNMNKLHNHHKCRDIMIETIKKNGLQHQEDLIPWNEYIRELYESKFCISFPGRGLDCHRTWNCLSLGTIPILLDTVLKPLYEGLPVVFVKDASEITPEFLDKKLTEITNNIDTYKFDKLYHSYWVRKIFGEMR